MNTKLPLTGNPVTTCGTRRRGERGIALISVIAVLVLLAMVATPFLLTMRDSAARGEKFVYSNRADAEADALFETVRSELIRGVEHLERRKLDDLGGSGLTGSQVEPSDATPTSDTPDEFQMPQSVLERFNRSNAKEHRIWSADIVDTQSLFNLNNCSYPILANILGHADVAAATTSDRQTIPLTRIPESFPRTDGVVRIGSECIKYKQIVGNDLVNCERGYLGSIAGNGPARDIDLGEPVMLEACYQIATRPFRWRSDKDGKAVWVRYTNVDQARTIGEMGVTALLPQDFERLRPFVTAWSGNAVGDGWSNPQLVRNSISSGGNLSNLFVKVKNVRYFGPGTMVRITDGVNEDYAVVTKIRGNDEVSLAGKIIHDYNADQARIYCLARSPINVNTADVSTLALVFSGLKMRGKSGFVTDRQAEDLAVYLKTWRKPVPTGTVAPAVPAAPGVYRNWEDLTKALESARDAGKIDLDGFEAVLRNAMNSNDSLLGFSTVPFVFRSYDTYEVRATVSIQGTGGRELARREIRRVMEVSTTRSGSFVLETQEDFQNQIIKSRDAKYMATFPVNVNAHYDGKNIPASEYQAYAQKSLFPSTDRASGVGDVQLLPAAFRILAGNRRDVVQHFDGERIPDGFEIKDAPFLISVDSPYDPQNGTLDLVDTATIEGLGDNVELGMKSFACSFWYKPDWTRDKSEHVIFDYGLDTDFMDRVSLRYDPADGGALVLSVADATREELAAEVRYTFDHGTWTQDQWYHIACHVHGCAPSMMALFVDGENQGRSNIQSRLTSGIPGTGTGAGQQISVEDAKHFPQTGVVIVRGRDGIELMEYNSKSDNELSVSRRKARSIVHTPTDATSRGHAEGDTVELYGFSAPLLTDVKKGGASLDATIGPWRVYRMRYEGDTLENPNAVPPASPIIARGLGQPAQGASGSAQVTIPLEEWDTGSTDPGILDDLGPAGTQGIAMISSTLFTGSASGIICGNASQQVAVQGQPQSGYEIGGSEFVLYQVSTTSGAVDIIQRNLTLRHTATDQVAAGDGLPRFFPSHEYGETSPDFNQATDPNNPGVVGSLTAFIPIAILGQGGSGQYLDPKDQEPQINSNVWPRNNSDANLHDGHAFVQVDGEWCAYDVFDETLISGKVAFYRDWRAFNAANRIGAAGNVHPPAATVQQSSGQGGGSGGNSTATPGVAIELNNESNVPPDPSSNGSTNAVQPAYAQNPVTSVDFARELDFRGCINTGAQTEHRIANTIPADHSSGVQILPTFLVVSGNNLEQSGTQNDGAAFAYPGFNDLLTLRDAKGNDEQIRVQWGYMGWCAPTAPTSQTWNWDRPQGPDGAYALRRWDSRAWTRALKFPSGEMPDNALTKAKQNIQFGKKYDNSGAVTPGTIDELVFWDFNTAQKDRANYTFLGTVPAEVADPNVQATVGSSGVPAPPPTFSGIDDQTDEFNVHLPVLDSSGQVLYPYGTPVDANTYSTDGGVIKIDDELILYEQFDAEQGKFSGCVRGAFGTDPQPHQYEALVVAVHSFPSSRLAAGVDTSSGDYQLEDTSDFPDDGYLRIGLNNEIIGYTNWDTAHLTAPLGRIEAGIDKTSRDPSTVDKRVGGSIFRGRFGTVPQAANTGEVAIAMPFRVYDRYAEYADDPEQSYLELSWTKHGGIWKRITWDEEPRSFIEVIALVRFSGGPAWDSDKIIHVGQEQMPTDDRRRYLYQISDPTAQNLLNIEADRIEVRLGIRFAKGAYDRIAQIAPDSWKESPAIRKVVVEYVAPPQVLTQE